MAKGRQARERKKQQKLDSRRRLKKTRKRNPTLVAKQITPKLADKVDDAYDLIRIRKFAEAEQLLDRLDKQYDRYPGPDAMRHEALNILGREARVDSGPHRFYSRGKWTEIKLFMAKIHWEATQCATPWVQEFVETGTEALKRGDFTLAEKSFNRVLDKEPDNCSAAYNLCVVWLERDGKSGRRRAQARMEEIHEQFPDYLFAPISLAQFAAMDGDLTRASDLLEPILDAKTLHVTEAIALFTAQVQIAIRRHEFDSAEQSLALLVQIAGEDDPKVATLRRHIDTASGRRGLSRLLSWV
jgi:predicted Zn-dependent protease